MSIGLYVLAAGAGGRKKIVEHATSITWTHVGQAKVSVSVGSMAGALSEEQTIGRAVRGIGVDTQLRADASRAAAQAEAARARVHDHGLAVAREHLRLPKVD